MEAAFTAVAILLVAVVFSFTVVGALDPAGDPIGWWQDKFDSFRARFR